MYFKKILLAVALIGLVAMAGFSYYVYSNIFVPNTAFNNEEAHVYIETGSNFNDVKQELEPLLKDMGTFETVANRKGYSNNIKAGHYIVKKGSNNNEIINSIRTGNIPVLVKFNNQERLEDLAGHLSNQLEADSISLYKALSDSVFLKKSGFNGDTALGMFIPNTYEVYWNTSPESFRDKMLAEYNAFWTSNRNAKAKQLGLTRDQVMALAAIVQKETAKVDERPRVAGVYINRIKKGMPLQADPTVIYAKKKTENNYNQVIKRVLYKDLEIDSPYNTYKYAGVPPGPIAMPDVTSIDGVLNFEKHDYYYFVADVTNFGYHKFASTLRQHNNNKNQYVEWVNKNGINR
ncbi:aminodeoxychorismate lyase [Patiriisocius marinistellae]|uniref:Endolytic murein transglycosylase n=1 Tax=Patiriisocius marinistellae TaxID=2494560 RepID=A0A5J4FZK4_9FLAO|nr:endolytic transglycosylase MltG [Patiriisocius marinistellae]GEQ86672.1 aminodeoxychorismate lyase [Patiriisocius marinistellae]